MAEIKDRLGVRSSSWSDVNFEILGMIKAITPALAELREKVGSVGFDGAEEMIGGAMEALLTVRSSMVYAIGKEQETKKITDPEFMSKEELEHGE